MHDLIIKSVLDNNGAIVGGYVREWVRFGQPQNSGWSDIDVICQDEQKIKIEKSLKDLGITADFRATPPFNDFFCNCWMFDGEIKPIEPKDKRFSEEEIKRQTQENEARMMSSIFPRRDKLEFFQSNNWRIYFPNGKIAEPKILSLFMNLPSVSIKIKPSA